MLIPLLTLCLCYPTSTSYIALNNYTCPPRRPTLHILRSRSRTENRRRSRFLDDSPLLRFSLFVLAFLLPALLALHPARPAHPACAAPCQQRPKLALPSNPPSWHPNPIQRSLALW